MCILQTKTFKEETPCNAGFPTGVVNMGGGSLNFDGGELKSKAWGNLRCPKIPATKFFLQ